MRGWKHIGTGNFCYYLLVMAKRIKSLHTDLFDEAVALFCHASRPVALTGAGISVESGIPDFRSPGGLWSVFRPDEFATLEVFLQDPGKAWKLYRALGEALIDKEPGAAHKALAELERAGGLQAVITQNIDGLHTKAGSQKVLEVHGEHQNLQCVRCESVRPLEQEDLSEGPVPVCSDCAFPLKPNIVLFGELVREMQRIETLLESCDLLLVIGTSAQVYPVASFPYIVKSNGGKIYEFNTEETALTASGDFFIRGKAGTTVPAFVQAVLQQEG